MRLVVISDTHCQHEWLGDLEGDVLIHCGDSRNGFSRSAGDLESLDRWFGRQRFELILCIGGNHDFELESRVGQGKRVFENATYLQDASHEHRGVTFYGAPWTPDLPGWAFYLDTVGLRSKWAQIPRGTGVLITHIGPHGILDRNRLGRSFGCPALLDRLAAVRPRLHAFGHNHASAGTALVDGTLHVNAAMVDSQYQVARSPYLFDIQPDGRLAEVAARTRRPA